MTKNAVTSWILGFICLAAGVDIYFIARNFGGGILFALPGGLLSLCCIAGAGVNFVHAVGKELPAEYLKWAQWPSSIGQLAAAFCAGIHMFWEIGKGSTDFDAAMFWLVALIAVIALAGHDLATTWNLIKREMSVVGTEMRKEAGNLSKNMKDAAKPEAPPSRRQPDAPANDAPLRF